MALMIREFSGHGGFGGSAIRECTALKLAERWPCGLQRNSIYKLRVVRIDRDRVHLSNHISGIMRMWDVLCVCTVLDQLTLV
jgi:hypothetical protein